MLGALCDGPVDVTRLGHGQDNGRTGRALAQMGVRLEPLSADALRVHGVGIDGLRAPSDTIDCGNSGTTMRLLLGLLGGRFSARLDGDAYLRRRPMRRVVEPLAEMGIATDGPRGETGELYAPLQLSASGGPIHAIDYTSKVASAQVKSAILLAGLRADGATSVTEPSLSRDHTERMLRYFGVALESHSKEGAAIARLSATPRRLRARPLAIPGDLSSAAFLLGAALLVPGSEITVQGVGLNPTRAGVLDVLLQMGAAVEATADGGESVEPEGALTARSSSLRGTRICGALSVRSIDELPLLATLAAFADGQTVVTDASELRVKESDRVAATARMLRAFGAEIDERPDGWVIAGRGVGLHAATVQSEGDHRIAMSAAIAALAIDGETTIVDAANVATSFPSFVALLRQLGADIEEI